LLAQWNSREGDNIANVVQYLADEHPETVQNILQRLAERVPKLEHVDSEQTIDGRLALLFKDAPFTNNAIKLRVFTQVCSDKI